MYCASLNRHLTIMADDITLGYSLQRILPAKWVDYKAIRLEALKSNPDMFGSNYIKESVYTERHWTTLLEENSRGIFGLYQQGAIVGLTAVAVKKERPLEAICYATYINKEHRGKGLTQLFFPVRIEWARQYGCHKITVSHRSGNEASQAAIKRFGFKYDYSEAADWPDGTSADELFYSLQLRR